VKQNVSQMPYALSGSNRNMNEWYTIIIDQTIDDVTALSTTPWKSGQGPKVCRAIEGESVCVLYLMTPSQTSALQRGMIIWQQ
jgi:hypothetical protein